MPKSTTSRKSMEIRANYPSESVFADRVVIVDDIECLRSNGEWDADRMAEVLRWCNFPARNSRPGLIVADRQLTYSVRQDDKFCEAWITASTKTQYIDRLMMYYGPTSTPWLRMGETREFTPVTVKFFGFSSFQFAATPNDAWLRIFEAALPTLKIDAAKWAGHSELWEHFDCADVYVEIHRRLSGDGALGDVVLLTPDDDVGIKARAFMVDRRTMS